MLKKIAVIGSGGLSKELIYNIPKKYFDYFVSKHLITKENEKAIEDLDFSKYKILFAIGDPKIRKEINDTFPKNTEYLTYIDKYANILDKNNVKIGKGSVICAGTIITSNVTIGDFSQINLNCTIGHDCNIGDYFTSSPGVNVAGNCIIGNNCYIGTNSALINNLKICDNVTIGMSSNVIKDIKISGVYVGNPLRKIK